MQVTEKNELCSAAGKLAVFGDYGFLVAHTTTHVRVSKSEPMKVECEVKSNYDELGKLNKLRNNTDRIRNVKTQTDFFIDQQNTTICTILRARCFFQRAAHVHSIQAVQYEDCPCSKVKKSA